MKDPHLSFSREYEERTDKELNRLRQLSPVLQMESAPCSGHSRLLTQWRSIFRGPNGQPSNQPEARD